MTYPISCSICLRTDVWRTYSWIGSIASSPQNSLVCWKISSLQSQLVVSCCATSGCQNNLCVTVNGSLFRLQVTSIRGWRRSFFGTANSWARTRPSSCWTRCSFSAASISASQRWSSIASCPSRTSCAASKLTRITPRPPSCASIPHQVQTRQSQAPV